MGELIEEQLITADVLFGLIMGWQILVLPFLLYFRNSPFIKQRDLVLVLILWIASTSRIIRIYFNAIDKVTEIPNHWAPCSVLLWISNMPYNAWLLMIVVRCVRLLLLFKISKWKLENDDKKRPFWCNEKFFSREYMLYLFGLLWIISMIMVIPVAVYVGQTGVCNDDIILLPATILVVPANVGIIIIGWHLRPVHDAFGIKKEFKLLAIYAAILGGPFTVVSFITSWGWVFGLLTAGLFDVILYGTPIYLCLKEKFADSSNSSSESYIDKVSSEGASVGDDAPESQTVPLLCVHPEYKKYFGELSVIMPYIEKYLLHYQEVELCHVLLFGVHLLKFKELRNEDILTGKAFLICQKFLFDNAYLPVVGLDPSLRSQAIQTVNDAVKSVESNWDPDAPVKTSGVPKDLFDPLFAYVQQYLYEHLFKPFFKSPQFKEFLQTMTLKAGHEAV